MFWVSSRYIYSGFEPISLYLCLLETCTHFIFRFLVTYGYNLETFKTRISGPSDPDQHWNILYFYSPSSFYDTRFMRGFKTLVLPSLSLSHESHYKYKYFFFFFLENHKMLSSIRSGGMDYYQKLRVRVAHIWGHRMGQPARSVMDGSHLHDHAIEPECQ